MAIPPVVAASLISGGASVAGGLLSKKNKDASKGIYEDAKRRVDAVRIPTIEEQKIQLEQMVQQGVITPEQYQAILQDPTAMEAISVDPRFKQAQMDALNEYQRISSAGGLTAMDKALLQDISDAQNAEERGSREAILQNMRERGTSNAGFELSAQLMAQQEAANRAARRGTDVAAQAEARKLAALTGASQLAGQMGDTDYARQAELAKAKDIINNFNTSNRQNVSNMNTSTANVAQASNLSEKQRVADSNTSNVNANRERNSNLIQQNYVNEMNKATAPLGVINNQATNAQRVSDANTTRANNIVGTGLNAVANTISAFSNPTATPTSKTVSGGNSTPVPGSDYEAQLRKMLGY